MSATETRIEGAVTEIDIDLAILANFASGDSEPVKQIKITEALAAAQSAITIAEAELAATQVKVDAKTGLNAAINANNAAEAAAAEAAATFDDAKTQQDIKLAALGIQTDSDATKHDVEDDNTVDDIIVINDDTGALELDATWAEDDSTTAEMLAAAQELLAAINARVAAEQAKLALDKAALEAAVNVALVEGEEDGMSDLLDAYNDAMELDGDDAVTSVTLNQLKAAQADLLGKAMAQLVDDAEITFDATDFTISNDADNFKDVDSGNSAVLDAYNDLQTAINTYETESKTPIATELSTKGTALTDAQEKLTDLQDQIAERAEAVALLEQWNALKDAYNEAFESFEKLGYSDPIELDGTPTVATADADIFIAGSTNTQIVNFGLAGEDMLYIGTAYTLNPGTLKDGDNSVLEVFFVQKVNGTEVHLETQTYSSNEDGVPDTVITLTGINASDLTLTSDGIITLA